MANQTIVSLALLKVTWDKNRTGYLDTFLPMLVECLRLQADDIVSVPCLKKAMMTNFGLSIPHNVIVSILKKARRQGYVYDRNEAVYRNSEKVDSTEFQECQSEVIRSHESLIESLASHANSEYSCDWSNEKAEAALFGYLERYELVSCNRDSDETICAQPSPAVAKQRSDDYVVAAFIKHLATTHSSQYAFMEMIITGNMLKDALYLADIGQIDRKFKHTGVYLDTPFLMFALGHAGPVRKEPCTELLDLLYSVGADLRCFQHTYDEIFDILHFCERTLDEGSSATAHGPSIEYFITQGYTASDVILMKENLERDLHTLRVDVVETPAYDEYKFVIDEAGLTTELNGRITYHNEKPVERDVASLSATARLRRGRRSHHFEDCSALFVTTNGLLCSIAQQFLDRENGESGYVPVCVTDHMITSLLWIKQPLKAPDLPRKRLIADCYAALQPSTSLLQAFQNEVNRLETDGTYTPSDVFALRYAVEAKQALMEVTLGNPDAFVQGTIPEILKLTKEKIAHEERDKLTGEIQELTKAKDVLLDYKKREVAELSAIESRASEIAGKTVRIACCAILVSYLSLTVLVGVRWSGVAASGPFILAVVGGMSFVYGTSVKSCLRSMEVGIARFIKRWLIARRAWGSQG